MRGVWTMSDGNIFIDLSYAIRQDVFWLGLVIGFLAGAWAAGSAIYGEWKG